MLFSQQSRRRTVTSFAFQSIAFCVVIAGGFLALVMYGLHMTGVFLSRSWINGDGHVQLQGPITPLAELLSEVPSDNLREVVSIRENKDITQSNPSNLMKKQQDENALIKNISTNILTGVTDVVHSNTTEKSMCSSKYSKRSFFSPSAARLPPMLYSFPGSGNTWCRLLIEYGLGIYSGSVYNDISLMSSLPGEFSCNKRVSVIKIHPHTHPFDLLQHGGFHSDGQLKCNKGGVTHFKRAVLLIRNPFDSIWSEYQRRESKSHVGGIQRAVFDWHRWQANAAALSNDYFDMWHQEYTSIDKTFATEDVLYVRYEDLRNETIRVQVMSKIAQFLKVDVSDDRLDCAFELASKTATHRIKDDPDVMTKQMAYTVPLTCKMWMLFGMYASKHGYGIINEHDCSGFTKKDAISDVTIGSAGQYDLTYVPEGEKLVDFGGYDAASRIKSNTNLPNPEKKTKKKKKREAKKQVMSGLNLEGIRLNNVGGDVGEKGMSLSMKPPSGMTLEEAENVPGVGGLGKTKPAWQ